MTKKLISGVKAGQTYLKWDDSTYRSVIARITGGKTSATKCTLEELENIKEYMHGQWFPRKSSKKHGRTPNVAMSRKAIQGKIEALLSEADRPWQYAESMAVHMFKRQAIEWLTTAELTKLMQALIIDAKRHGRRTS
ncbi:regulatory protein GemA [Limnobaculum zhutongyuii]|nr:regulatory protein GemA [Limnobaculum zhutongyuii]